uniref:Uncharacterized protein n=1 Tax=Glossina austeni TaxID=7395 RepID=A0A1A9VNL1_GLOAU
MQAKVMYHIKTHRAFNEFRPVTNADIILYVFKGIHVVVIYISMHILLLRRNVASKCIEFKASSIGIAKFQFRQHKPISPFTIMVPPKCFELLLNIGLAIWSSVERQPGRSI